MKPHASLFLDHLAAPLTLPVMQEYQMNAQSGAKLNGWHGSGSMNPAGRHLKHAEPIGLRIWSAALCFPYAGK
jgi:hypothetical protein